MAGAALHALGIHRLAREVEIPEPSQTVEPRDAGTQGAARQLKHRPVSAS
jgi:hypothetical protein